VIYFLFPESKQRRTNRTLCAVWAGPPSFAAAQFHNGRINTSPLRPAHLTATTRPPLILPLTLAARGRLVPTPPHRSRAIPLVYLAAGRLFDCGRTGLDPDEHASIQIQVRASLPSPTISPSLIVRCPSRDFSVETPVLMWAMELTWFSLARDPIRMVSLGALCDLGC
jgi:hypothetical protein